MTDTAQAAALGRSSTPRILVVDDQPGIRDSLGALLKDHGLTIAAARNGEEALSIIEAERPDLVLLDIWLPGMDGMEVLQKLLDRYPGLPVVMMSGHATIETAVQATKLGAKDFIEKPLDADRLLEKVDSLLQEPSQVWEGGSGQEAQSGEQQARPRSGQEERKAAPLLPVQLRNDLWRGSERTQKTLRSSAIIYGQGLHTGRKSGLVLEPLPENSGIHFVDVSGGGPVPAHVQFVESTGFATRLRREHVQVSTIEHLLSALHAHGITNLLVKCNEEVPILDGSANEFCRLIAETGVVEQDGTLFALRPAKEISVGSGEERLRLIPDEQFVIDYTLKYPEPLGTQRFCFTLDGPESYLEEIAPARTFGFVKDVGNLQSQGLAQGGRFDNFLLFGSEGAINSRLRFPDEAVRHKILDCIGDLYLLGRPIEGRLEAVMTGHSDNISLLQRIVSEWESEN